MGVNVGDIGDVVAFALEPAKHGELPGAAACFATSTRREGEKLPGTDTIEGGGLRTASVRTVERHLRSLFTIVVLETIERLANISRVRIPSRPWVIRFVRGDRL